MKASLEIEAIGDDVDQLSRLWTNITNDMVPGLGTLTFGLKKSYWVAQIVGRDAKYRYQRVFLRGRKDYARANSKGSRGVFVYYILESDNVYEVYRPSSWQRQDRYFCTVDNDGSIVRVTQEQAEQWINDHLASTSLTPPDSA